MFAAPPSIESKHSMSESRGQSGKLFIRRRLELKTIEVMVDMYCQAYHQGGSGGLCSVCDSLLDYAARRLDHCVFGDAKPTCANCQVHCYSAEKREQIRLVMKWAGPRMLLHHPIRAIFHLLDGRRPAPSLPVKRAKADIPDGLPDFSHRR